MDRGLWQDVVFYHTRACKVPRGQGPSLGCTLAIPHPSGSHIRSEVELSPSTAEIVDELCACDIYTTRPPQINTIFSKFSPRFFTAWHQGLRAAQNSCGGKEPQFIPVATVEWDNRNLGWPAPNCTPAPLMCASKENCAACSLVGAPGPLPAYQLPGIDGPGLPLQYCLLCIREDVHGLIVKDRAKAAVYGSGPCIQPPFQNLVGCPGGYAAEVCSVRPGRQQLFVGGCHIVGVSGNLRVRVNTQSGLPYVDQSPLMFEANLHGDHFLE